MSPENNSTQEQAGVTNVPKPFDRDDTVRASQLEERFGLKLENNYVINGATVEITDEAVVVKKVPDSTPEGYTHVGQKIEECVIELPVMITDPNAAGDFKNVGRWSKYALHVDKKTGEVISSSRIDRRFDPKQRQYSYDGVAYQIQQPEVEKLMNTKAVQAALKSIGVEGL